MSEIFKAGDIITLKVYRGREQTRIYVDGEYIDLPAQVPDIHDYIDIVRMANHDESVREALNHLKILYELKR